MWVSRVETGIETRLGITIHPSSLKFKQILQNFAAFHKYKQESESQCANKETNSLIIVKKTTTTKKAL